MVGSPPSNFGDRTVAQARQICPKAFACSLLYGWGSIILGASLPQAANDSFKPINSSGQMTGVGRYLPVALTKTARFLCLFFPITCQHRPRQRKAAVNILCLAGPFVRCASRSCSASGPATTSCSVVRRRAAHPYARPATAAQRRDSGPPPDLGRGRPSIRSDFLSQSSSSRPD
jgi:hypothetical protein